MEKRKPNPKVAAKKNVWWLSAKPSSGPSFPGLQTRWPRGRGPSRPACQASSSPLFLSPSLLPPLPLVSPRLERPATITATEKGRSDLWAVQSTAPKSVAEMASPPPSPRPPNAAGPAPSRWEAKWRPRLMVAGELACVFVVAFSSVKVALACFSLHASWVADVFTWGWVSLSM